MNDIQQPKSDPKGKAIASLILSIISPVILLLAYGGFFLMNYTTDIEQEELSILAILIIIPSFILGILISIIAIILGIFGLKSTKSNYAMAGIILSVIFWVVLTFGIYYAIGR